jgi:GAF domain-containing protein
MHGGDARARDGVIRLVQTHIPPNDRERLSAVRRYEILDTPPDGAFDRITALAARLFDVPISIVSIVDEDRIWFKSHHGIEVEEIAREPGLCASAVCHFEPWIVENAEVDPRTITNPLVAGELGLRFYAGVPLTTADGFNLGTLNVIDLKPRRFSPEDTQTLKELAAIVVHELELRLAVRSYIRDRRNEAMELQDTVVQRLTAARLAGELNEQDQVAQAVDQALKAARKLVGRLLAEAETMGEVGPGQFVRQLKAEGSNEAEQR